MVWIGHIRSDKFRRDIVSRTFALIAPDWPVCIEFSAVTKRSQMHPNITKMQQNMSLGSNGVDRAQFQTRLRYTNFCISCTRLAHLHRVQYRNKTVPNAPKHYEMKQNICLGSHGVYWESSQRKVPTRLRGIKFCINCTSSAHFALILLQEQNVPKCTPNITKCNKT